MKADSTKYVSRRRPYTSKLWQNISPLIRHLDIELTERCDNNCIHCSVNLPANDQKSIGRELSTADWKRIIKEAADLGVLSIRFTGGEPLLRKDFGELYQFARRLGIKVILFTNARNLTPELIELFARIPPLEKIEVSFYGLRQKSYEAVSRVNGSYLEARRGIDLLLRNNISFIVKGAILPSTRSEIEDFENWAATLPGMNEPPGFSIFFDLRGRRDSKEKNRLIKSLRIPAYDGMKILKRHETSYRQNTLAFCSKFSRPPGKQLFNCRAVYGSSVDAYGGFQPCILMRAPDLVYDLKSGNLKSAITEFFPRLRYIEASNEDYLERCSRCFLKGLCQQCPAKSWAEHGALDTPVEYYCKIAHAQARDLNLLHDGECAWNIHDWKQRINELLKGNEDDRSE